jgi:hypothetical protein
MNGNGNVVPGEVINQGETGKGAQWQAHVLRCN